MKEDGHAPPSVMLVDGHRLYREGLCNLLQEQGFSTAAEAQDGTEAVSLAARIKPDVALMEIELADCSGIEAMRRVRLVSPPTRVVMLTVSANEQDVAEAIQAGASGYLLKEASVDFIVASVRAAAAGESLLSPRVAADLLDRLRESRPPRQVPKDLLPKLTTRELGVLSLIVAGKENAQIAEKLVISEQTVKSHVSSVLSKLGVENRVQAAVYAVREQLLGDAID
jgi:DNA-binding NarL/FixJ family response regulator